MNSRGTAPVCADWNANFESVIVDDEADPATARSRRPLQGKRARLRVLEKGNKKELVWLHHEAEQYLDAYLEAANINETAAPVFQTLNKNHWLTGDPITRRDMLRIVKERCAAAGLPESICNHTFRGTRITVFLQNGGALEAAQDMANHSDPRTTKLYDRRKDLATLSETERRIAF